ncbi:DUF2169 domain-containing protein [Alcaligenes faecalis]|uniref:DUF2169 family type VI secretion system accessory protein n=1 Tax=Alcaligenes faecalis TaxID=511 RepID=UPI00137C1FB2|nr:DUF2169 domain-containing protein [Alcaligenes faecalis]QHS37874.1 DUF2169 domain-containing protein [Alcaligenes faecalis]
MRIVKPLRLGILTRPWSWRGQHALSVSVQAWCSMDAPHVLSTDARMWQSVSDLMQDDDVLDLALPKPCAEFLVSGHACAPGGEPVSQLAVQARVGPIEKQLAVFGQRQWRQGRPGEAEPFTRVPLDGSRSWGGAEYPDNPAGMGMEAASPGEPLCLPQVEPWEGRLHRSGQQGRPAGLGPVSPLRPRRFRLAGRYEPAWQQGDPGMMLDSLDPHFFNAAEPDQWWREQSHWPADSSWELHHLHAQRPRWSGSLPQWEAICWYQDRRLPGLQKLELRHTTVWFFPDLGHMLLLYQGSVPVQDAQAQDVNLLMPALEPFGMPRGQDHYEQVLRLRSEGDQAGLFALRDQDLLPADCCAPLDDFQTSSDDPLSLTMRMRLERWAQDAAHEHPAWQNELFSLAQVGPPKPMDVDRTDWVQEVRQANRQQWEARQQMEEGMTKVQDLQRESPFQNQASTRVTVRDTQRMLCELDATASDQAPVSGLLSKPMEEARRAMQTYAPAPPAASDLRQQRLRRRVELILAGTRNLSGLDLSGLHLQDFDFSGVRCVGTSFNDAVLQQGTFAGADCSGATFVRARLEQIQFDQSQLDDVDFSAAVLQSVQFRQVQAARWQPRESSWQDVLFQQSHLQEQEWLDVDLLRCTFEASHLQGVQYLMRSRLSELSYLDCQLQQCAWLDCDLRSLSLKGSSLEDTSWLLGLLDGVVDCRDSTWRQSVVSGLAMPGSNWRGARLEESNLRGLDLSQSCFEQAQLIRCDLSGANLQGSQWTQARLSDCILIETDFSLATLNKVDMSNSLAGGANVQGSVLDTVNFFRADLMGLQTDARTRSRNLYLRTARRDPAGGQA